MRLQTELERLVCLGVTKVQPAGAQADLLPGVRVFAVRVVFGIPGDGAAHMRQLYADLVVAAGIQPDIKLRGAWKFGKMKSV